MNDATPRLKDAILAEVLARADARLVADYLHNELAKRDITIQCLQKRIEELERDASG